MSVMGPKRGDLEPPLVIDIEDGRQLADFTTVVSWRVIGRMRDTPTVILFDDTNPGRTVDPVNKWKATVTHVWSTGDTAVAGVMQIEVEVKWPGTPLRSQTFPNGGYQTVVIDDDLG